MKGNHTNISGHFLPTDLDAGWKVGLTVAYTLVLTLSVFGNSLIIYNLWKNASLRTTANLFIGSISALNLLTNFLCHFVQILQLNIGHVCFHGREGEMFCAFALYFRGAFYLLFLSHLVVISVEAFETIARKVRVMSSKHIRLLLIFTWCVPLILTLPIAYKARVKKHKGQFVCRFDTRNYDETIVSYIMFGFLFGFLVPLTVMAALLIKAWYKLWIGLAFAETSEDGKQSHLKKKNVAIVTTAMVAAFTGCRFPLEVFNLCVIVAGNKHFSADEEKIFRSLEILSCCNSALIPLINIILNQTIHKNGKRLITCCNYGHFSGRRVNRIMVQSKNDDGSTNGLKEHETQVDTKSL